MIGAAWVAGKALAGRIPRWAWLALAVALILLGGWRWHVNSVRHADRAGYARALAEVKAKSDRVVKAANDATAKATNLAVIINREERARADEENRRSAGLASELRGLRPVQPLHCRVASAAAVPGSPGGRAAIDRPADAPVVAVDWQWLIDRAEQADLNRTEVLAWRSWHDKQSTAYEQWRRDWLKAGSDRASP